MVSFFAEGGRLAADAVESGIQRRSAWRGYNAFNGKDELAALSA